MKKPKEMSLSELHYAAGRAILSQGNGPAFSRMLENRIEALEREIAKRNKPIHHEMPNLQRSR